MKKLLTGITLAGLLVAPAVAMAAVPDETVPSDIDIIIALEDLADWLFTILLIIAVIFIIVAAFTFVTAAGDVDKVAKARRFVLYALIGIAVAVASRGLVSLVRTIMGD